MPHKNNYFIIIGFAIIVFSINMLKPFFFFFSVFIFSLVNLLLILIFYLCFGYFSTSSTTKE